MHILSAAQLGLTRIPDKDDIARCAITLPSGAVTSTLQGQYLEAGIAMPQHIVLFLTDDVLYDEQLHIYLLNHQATVLDAATLGAWDTAAIFSDLCLQPPHRIRFGFFGQDCWEFCLYDAPRQSWLPRRSGSPWVRRPWQRQRHFALRAVPRPETPTHLNSP